MSGGQRAHAPQDTRITRYRITIQARERDQQVERIYSARGGTDPAPRTDLTLSRTPRKAPRTREVKRGGSAWPCPITHPQPNLHTNPPVDVHKQSPRTPRRVPVGWGIRLARHRPCERSLAGGARPPNPTTSLTPHVDVHEQVPQRGGPPTWGSLNVGEIHLARHRQSEGSQAERLDIVPPPTQQTL